MGLKEPKEPDVIIGFWDGNNITRVLHASDSETGFVLIDTEKMEADMNYIEENKEDG